MRDLMTSKSMSVTGASSVRGTQCLTEDRFPQDVERDESRSRELGLSEIGI